MKLLAMTIFCIIFTISICGCLDNKKMEDENLVKSIISNMNDQLEFIESYRLKTNYSTTLQDSNDTFFFFKSIIQTDIDVVNNKMKKSEEQDLLLYNSIINTYIINYVRYANTTSLILGKKNSTYEKKNITKEEFNESDILKSIIITNLTQAEENISLLKENTTNGKDCYVLKLVSPLCFYEYVNEKESFGDNNTLLSADVQYWINKNNHLPVKILILMEHKMNQSIMGMDILSTEIEYNFMDYNTSFYIEPPEWQVNCTWIAN